MASTISSLKKLQRTANDASSASRRSSVAFLTAQSYTQPFLFRSAVIVLLGVIVSLLAVDVWQGLQRQEQSLALAAPATSSKIIVKLEQDGAPESARAKSKIESTRMAAADPGIILPASSLSPDVAQNEKAVHAVADKISDLPAIQDAKLDTLSTHAVHVGQDDDEASIEQLLDDAHDLLETGYDADALALYDQVLNHDPTNSAALDGKMYALQHSSQGEKAVETGRQLLQLDPDNKTSRLRLTNALGQSYLPAAMHELEQNVADDPQDAVALVALAKLEMRHGYFEKAHAHLTRAMQIEPDNLAYRLDMAILYDKAGYSADAASL